MTDAADVFSPAEIEKILSMKSYFNIIHKEHMKGNEGFFIAYKESYVYAGGAFASQWWHEQPKDIDFFILDNPSATLWFETFLIKAGSHAPTVTVHDIRYMKNKHIKKVATDHLTKIQYIFTDYKTREELMASFDYAHTKVSYYKDDLYITKATYDSIRDKKLVVTNQENWYPQREEKFLKRGWKQDLGAWTPLKGYAAALLGARMITPSHTQTMVNIITI